MTTLQPILLSSVTEKSADCLIAWDSMAGNPIASFTGEPVSKSCFLMTNQNIVAAANRKPILQMWSVASASLSHKRITTKGIVSAMCVTPRGDYIFLAIGTTIYIIQVNSGCIMGILTKGHSAVIGQLLLVSWDSISPALLLSADGSGFIGCWDLGQVFDSFSETQSIENIDNGCSLTWFAVQVSRGQPKMEALSDSIACVGSDGMKIFSFDGRLLSSKILCEGHLHSIAVIKRDSTIFCGGENGILYMTSFQNSTLLDQEHEVIKRKCFVETALVGVQRAIVELSLSPYDNGLLAVGARGAFVEILNCKDPTLPRLQRFSLLRTTSLNVNPTNNRQNCHGTSLHDVGSFCQLTGLKFVRSFSASTFGDVDAVQMSKGMEESCKLGLMSTKRRNNAQYNVKDIESDERPPDSSFGIEQLKRHIGWKFDDVVHTKLYPVSQCFENILESDFYMDDYATSNISSRCMVKTGVSSVRSHEIKNLSCLQEVNSDCEEKYKNKRPKVDITPSIEEKKDSQLVELKLLHKKVARLESVNRLLLCRLAEKELK